MEPTKQSYRLTRERIRKQKALFLEHLKKTPLVEVVCLKVGISRATVYRWRKEDKKFDTAFAEAMYLGTDVTNDVVESALLQGAQRGNPALIKFYLQHRHPAYNVNAARYKKKLEDTSGIVEEDTLSPEDREKVDLMLADITAFQAQWKDEGLVTPDAPPVDASEKPPDEPTVS